MWRILPSRLSSTRAPSDSSIGHLRVGAVELIEVDALETQGAQAALERLAQVLPAGRRAASSPGPVRSRPPLVAITSPSG